MRFAHIWLTVYRPARTGIGALSITHTRCDTHRSRCFNPPSEPAALGAAEHGLDVSQDVKPPCSTCPGPKGSGAIFFGRLFLVHEWATSLVDTPPKAAARLLQKQHLYYQRDRAKHHRVDEGVARPRHRPHHRGGMGVPPIASRNATANTSMILIT